MATFESWKKRKSLSDEDALTPGYLERRDNPENELIDCACGCGYKRMRFDKNGIERRYIVGHHMRGRTPSSETLEKIRLTRLRNKKPKKKDEKPIGLIKPTREETMRIYHILEYPRFQDTQEIAERVGMDPRRCQGILNYFEYILSLNFRIDKIQVGRMRGYKKILFNEEAS